MVPPPFLRGGFRTDRGWRSDFWQQFYQLQQAGLRRILTGLAFHLSPQLFSGTPASNIQFVASITGLSGKVKQSLSSVSLLYFHPMIAK